MYIRVGKTFFFWCCFVEGLGFADSDDIHLLRHTCPPEWDAECLLGVAVLCGEEVRILQKYNLSVLLGSQTTW